MLKHVLSCLRMKLLEGDHSHSQQCSAHIEDVNMQDEDDTRNMPSLRSVPMALVSNSSDENLVSLYPRTFVYQDAASNNSSHSQMIVVVLYNLAFASQMDAEAGVQDGRICRPALDSAKGFYKTAMEVTSSCWDEQGFDSAEWLALAILNNLGWIASQEMVFHDTQYATRIIVDFLSGPPETLNAIPEDDIDLFYLSVFTYFDGSELCIAPAA